jgi:hypothetical protein
MAIFCWAAIGKAIPVHSRKLRKRREPSKAGGKTFCITINILAQTVSFAELKIID